MLVQALETPNPHSTKFVPPCPVRGELESLFFRKQDPVGHAPIAKQLFAIEGVAAVFLGADFITITKFPQAEWLNITPAAMELIADFLENQKPLVTDESVRPVVSTAHVHRDAHAHHGCGTKVADGPILSDNIPVTNMDDPIVKEIMALIDDRVRPAVAQDGGEIVFRAFHESVVYLSMHGACAGCPGANFTLKNGVENMLRYYIPEVREVRLVEEAA